VTKKVRAAELRWQDNHADGEAILIAGWRGCLHAIAIFA